jgi:heme-degrading monooxygenase HmoA
VHIQIVNFRLEGMSETEYRGIAETIAPAFANLPGLVSKTWLADPETDTYGGVYVWQSREAMENYKESDIYKGMATNPHFADVTVKDFAVLEGPTRVTRGPAAGVAA